MDTQPSLPKKGAEPPPQFSAHLYCSQMTGCLKTPLGMEVNLSLGDFVLDRHPAPPIFGPCLLRPNGCMDQYATCYGGRPQPRGLLLDGNPASSPKRGRSPSAIFGSCLLWPNGWMDQDGTWHGVGPSSRPHCARW